MFITGLKRYQAGRLEQVVQGVYRGNTLRYGLSEYKPGMAYFGRHLEYPSATVKSRVRNSASIRAPQQ